MLYVAFVFGWLFLGFFTARCVFEGYPMDGCTQDAVAALGLTFSGPLGFTALLLFACFCIIKWFIGKLWDWLTPINKAFSYIVKLADL